MLLDVELYHRIVDHCCEVIDEATAEEFPFPYVLLKGIFPDDVYGTLLRYFPPEACFVKANPKHHSNEYGGSTRQRMTLAESSFDQLPEAHHRIWATIRAAIACRQVRDALFAKLASGLCRRFSLDRSQLSQISAYPRGQFYSETEGYRIAPHPDTREKVVTMQFAFAGDESLKEVGTEFYTRSLNPLNYLREPRGFLVAKTMPFLPNHAYAFSVLNELGIKSWHGRSTIPPMNRVRNTLLHIWYVEPDETDAELLEYQQFLRRASKLRKCA